MKAIDADMSWPGRLEGVMAVQAVVYMCVLSTHLDWGLDPVKGRTSQGSTSLAAGLGLATLVVLKISDKGIKV